MLIRHFNKYRLIVLIGFLLATVLTLAYPVKMFGSSPWAYYFGVKNFAQGKFVIDEELYRSQQKEASQAGGRLQQYVQIGENRWALEKAPGYVFFLVPFEKLGITRWGNILLALGMTATAYLMLKSFKNEQTACIGSLLLLFTPTTLIMMNLTYMDTLASLAFTVMGGGLYIYYNLKKEFTNQTLNFIILFFAFFLLGCSVITRYTNLPIVAIFTLHFIITEIKSLRENETRYKKYLLESLSAMSGILIPLFVLLAYNNAVFGSPFDYGYNYTRFPIKFAYEYLGQTTKEGQSLPLQIILENLKKAPGALLTGYPVLAIFIPIYLLLLIVKIQQYFVKREISEGRFYRLSVSMSWQMLILLSGWIIAVFGLYLMYEFTADYLGGDSSFIRFARFYLPGLFPLIIITSITLDYLPRNTSLLVSGILIIAGLFIYLQYMNNDHFLYRNLQPDNMELRSDKVLLSVDLKDRFRYIVDFSSMEE